MDTDKKGRNGSSRANPGRNLLTRLHEIQRQNMALKSSLEGKQRTLRNIKKLADEKRKSLNDLLESQSGEMKKFQIEVKRLECDNERLYSEIKAKKAVRAEFQVTVTQNAEDESKNEEPRKNNIEEAEEKNIIDDVGECKIEMSHLKDEMNSLTLKLQQVTENNAQRKGECESLRKEINELSNTKREKQARIMEEMKEMEGIRPAVHSFINDFVRRMEELEKNKREVERKNVEVDREFSIWKLETKATLNDKENEIAAAQDRIEALQAQSREVKNKKKKLNRFRRVFRRLFRCRGNTSTETAADTRV